MDDTAKDNVITTLAGLCGDLVSDHWQDIKDTWAQEEDCKCKISLAVSLEGAMTAPRVSVKLGFSRRFSDEASVQLHDPNQAEMEFKS